MLEQHINRIIQSNPQYAGLQQAIEKEILHHDIFDVLIQQGVMQSLTFIGGTSLRLCYNSVRLSEDLDFTAGSSFKPSDLNGLDLQLQQYIERKYETEVTVKCPPEKKQGDTATWKISMARKANRPDIPKLNIHLDICALPSLTTEKKPLINHYNIVAPTSGILIPVQSLAEIMTDKFIALAYRAKRIVPRDIWDLTWISQRGTPVSMRLLEQKLELRGKSKADFDHAMSDKLLKLQNEDQVKRSFCNELSRFVPSHIKHRTLDDQDYWGYVQSEVTSLVESLLQNASDNPFDMGAK
ncbi:nucleotidyl transferase AbiEii/AbiGii toxin family protein [Pelagibaculum spongiae]|uniref:Nucleotidyl transferase AbiEii/AbiGii toxin family protein n=1 Tax=Pelagibaculum spongiae TaxID=2080658 RepID=A0A2V1GP52_9GAMM|nr:nucleotidyl transferase AbiEii/AbiGii toxin family protein [Pelagibaculum spongiae]PVZ64484.1 nucleotidyl transferase AbiEii/AbiGii toxin family protein [Pelagibaculum spongiae]